MFFREETYSGADVLDEWLLVGRVIMRDQHLGADGPSKDWG